MNDSNTSRFSELLDWLEGRLPPAEAQAVAKRLETADTATQADLDWLRLFLQTRQFVRFASPPSVVRETLRGRFAAYAEAREPPDFFRRWLATLAFDSRAQPAATGLRSAQRADEGAQRQLVYTTVAAEIALNVSSTLPDKSFIVTGQIFPLTDTPIGVFSIQLLRDTGEVALATTDELGEFTFSDLPAGEYYIVISTSQYEVVLPSFLLQP